MTGIDNTTEQMRDPANKLGFLGDALASGGQDEPIRRMERAGQRQVVNSDRLPSDFSGDRAEWEALGFTFGQPDEDDSLFMPVTLPTGWQREGSDHDMWSYVIDPLGRRRVGVFYKAAFYDRRASMHLTGLSSYVRDHVEYDGPLVLDDEWASQEKVAAAMREIRDSHLAEAADFRGYAADEKGRGADNRQHCAEIAKSKEADAAKYEAALTALKAGS